MLRDETICQGFKITNGSQVLLDVRIPIVDLREWGVAHVFAEPGRYVTVLWADRAALTRALARAPICDADRFAVLAEISRIEIATRPIVPNPPRRTPGVVIALPSGRPL